MRPTPDILKGFVLMIQRFKRFSDSLRNWLVCEVEIVKVTDFN